MGTNYYMRTLNEHTARALGHKTVEGCCGYELHLCKRSGGWDILFEGSDTIRSVGDIHTCLTNHPDIQIVDEYGREFSSEQFFAMIDDWNDRAEVHHADEPGLHTWTDAAGYTFTNAEFG